MSPKKKILHLITGLEVGGAEMMLLKTLPLLQADFDNRVSCIRGHGPIGKRLEDVGIPVAYLDLKSIFDIGVIFRFRAVVKGFDPDVLVTYLIHADLFGRIFGRLFGIRKIICSVRVKLIQFKYLPLLALDGLTSPLVTHYHFNSKTVADMYQKFFFFPERKITVIPNGLEIEKYQISIDTKKKRQSLNVSEEAIIIGCIGRLEKQKGQKYLIEAFSELVKQYPFAILLIIGNGTERKPLEELVKKSKIDNSVRFLGRRNDIPEILQILDIFVLPSLYEGMSNALMEAMATGLPIIATSIPENKELLGYEENGILVPPHNASALTEKMSFILRNETYTKKMRISAKKEAAKRFSLDTVIYGLTSLFRKI